MSREFRSFGAFGFFPQTGELFRRGERVDLQHQPSRVLDLLTALALPVTFGLNVFLARRLFGLVVVSPAALAAMGVFLMTVAVTAAYLPARVVTRLDPMRALRWD